MVHGMKEHTFETKLIQFDSDCIYTNRQLVIKISNIFKFPLIPTLLRRKLHKS